NRARLSGEPRPLRRAPAHPPHVDRRRQRESRRLTGAVFAPAPIRRALVVNSRGRFLPRPNMTTLQNLVAATAACLVMVTFQTPAAAAENATITNANDGWAAFRKCSEIREDQARHGVEARVPRLDTSTRMRRARTRSSA